MRRRNPMKYRSKGFLIGLVVGAALLVSACRDDEEISGPTANGRIMMYVVDDPADYDAVTIVVASVEAHVAGTDTISGWITLNQEAGVYDLLELRNGVSAVLADTTLAAGHYTQIRLIIGSGSTVTVDGIEYPLEIPSGMQTGLKLNHEFTIEPDVTYELTLDFDAEKSIHLTGGGTYQMNPVIRIQANALSGSISGTVVPPGPEVTAYATIGPDTVWAYPDIASGYFMLMALPAGSYSVVLTHSDPVIEDVIVDAEVIAEENTDLGVIVFGSP
jgi:hypothetical protein